MRFSDEFIEDVRARNDIVDVISGYVQLSHKGTSYKGLCPFHNEKTPSFSVHKGRQMYHCFGCGASGDVFNFLMEYDRQTFSEAVETLARRAGMDIPAESADPSGRAEKGLRDRLLEAHKEAAKYYFYVLYTPQGRQGLNYLKGRGLSDEIIKSFGLGYAGKTGTALYGYLKKQGFSDAELKESGLFVYDDKNGSARDKFWNRVMFPIMDQNRRVIGFGGRVMGDAKPKYLNSPETKIFEKSRNLYGLYAAKSSRKDHMIICEGYMDVISLHSAGFTNAVASLGTALTSQQAALIHRYVKNAILMYDSDEAGIQAARRAIPLLREAGINPKVCDLQPYKDPDEFIKGLGEAELEKRIEKAGNGFMFEIEQLKKSYDLTDPQGMADFQNVIVSELLKFPDEIERNSYLESIARTYTIDAALLKRQLSRLAMKGTPPPQKTREAPGAPSSARKDPAALRDEKILLSWMCKDEEVTSCLKKYITEADFTSDMHKELALALFEQAGSGAFNPVSILNRFEDVEEKSAAAAVMEGQLLPNDIGERNRAVLEVLTAVKERSYNRALSGADINDPEVMQRFLLEKQKLEELKRGGFAIGG